ncbi:MAG TPA: hypothetical protein VKC64_06080 [Burkholderiales bacterium]|nr:hypothetical protein [Burkholderiales bacterium]
MSRRITATITVEGDEASLASYRRRVNELLDAEREAPYRELHDATRLEYRISGDGVPYPAFVTASSEFPELTVAVRWQHAAGAASGRATIRSGRLAEEATETAAASAAGCELRADQDGTLVIGVVCRRRRQGEWIGYAVTANQHAFFRVERSDGGEVLEASDGAAGEWAERWRIAADRVDYTELEPRAPIDERMAGELDRLANDFADEWLWFADGAAAETAIERQRYGAYGLKVNAANVRTLKLKTAMRETATGGFALAMSDPEASAIAALVARHWLQTARD